MLAIKAARFTRLITQISSYASTTSSNYAGTSQLNNQILISKNWSQFFKIFKANKQSFSLDTFHISSRYITQLLSKQKENISYSDFIQIVNVISNLDISNMTESNILSVLALLRNFCNKGLEMSTVYKLKNKLCGKCNEIIINKPVGKENISELIYVYYEMAFFGWQPGSRYVSQRIMNRINKQPENISILTLSQCTFLLNALATKGDLVNYERKLRFYILKTLVNKLDVIKLQDLVNAIVSVNKMDFYDANTQQQLLVKQLGAKMLQNITELQQKSIFEFLKGDHNNKHPIFFKLYEDLIKSTYREIQQNGTTTFDYRTVLRLISHLSSRFSFNSHTQLEKKKLYKFLKNAAQHFQTENDTQGTRQLQMNVQELLRNRYHNNTKNQEIVEILSKGNVPLRFPLLEVLYNHKVNIDKFLQTFLQNNNTENSSIPSLIKLCSFLRKVSKNPKYQSQAKIIEKFLQSPTKKIEAIFQNPDVFSDNFNFFFRNLDLGINYRSFHEQFDYFSKLPNPFQLEEGETSPFYKLAYLNYIVNAFKPKDFYKFVKDYNSKINNLVIAKVVFNHVSEDSRKIQPNRLIVHLVFRNLSKAIEQNEKDFINASLQLLSKYSRFIVCSDRDFELAKYITKIIIIYLNKIQTLKEGDINKMFFPILAKYINRNVGNYRNQQIYRDILHHSFKILDKLSIFLVVQILKQGLRLNLVNKKTLENVDLSNINGFNYFEKQTLAYIQDSSKVTQINNINPASLPAIFANHNLQNFIIQNQAEIIKALEKAYINDRVECLTIFNQPMSKVSAKMVSKILELITSNTLPLQRTDFQGAINNLLQRGYTNALGTRQFAQKIISLLTNKMGLFSLWTHSEAIRFAISIPSFNPKEYYNKLVQYTEKFNQSEMQELLYRLAFTNYDFKTQDLKYVRSLLKKNIFRGIYLFLATENMHSEENRKLIVSELVHKLKEGKEGQANIQKFQYEYLKRAYPFETKDLDLKPEQLQKAVYFIRPRQKIFNILQKLANHHQVSLETLPDFEQNHIFKIKNLCICFLNSKRNGSYHQHEFLKRALNLYYNDQGYTFMFSVFAKVAKMPEYIEKYAPELITPEFKQEITQFLQTFREKFQQEQVQQKNTEKRQYKEKERKSRKPSV